MTLQTSTIMKTKFTHTFNAQSYIESVAYSKANKAYQRSGQKRADSVYKTYMGSGLKLWAYLTSKMPWYEAEKWLRLKFGNEDTFDRPIQAEKRVPNSGLKPGAECWAKSVIDDYKSIVKKIADFEHGTKSESNRQRILKNALNEAQIFLSVKPDIYDVGKHGKWISESEFNSMLEKMKETVAQYAAVPTTQIAA